MKLRRVFVWLLAASILAPLASAADAPPAASAQPAPDNEKKTELELRMDRMGKAFRKLKKQVSDPAQNASSLQLVATMQAAAKEAVDLTPEKAQDLPADQRPKFIEDYRAGIKGLLDRFDQLQEALTAGKNDEAAKLVSALGDYQKKEHKEFRKPKDN
jgi:soluble cytochrome b562